MSLHLVFDSPKGYRPKVGEIFLMKTTVGYIPVGVTSTEALHGSCVMLHPYRALVHDITDVSYASLVETNELLIPPVMLPKSDFRKGSWFAKVASKNTPTLWGVVIVVDGKPRYDKTGKHATGLSKNNSNNNAVTQC